VKQSNYDAAADILAGGAKALLRAGSQQGAAASGGDLAIMMVVEVYNKAGWEIPDGEEDAVTRARKSKYNIFWLCYFGGAARILLSLSEALRGSLSCRVFPGPSGDCLDSYVVKRLDHDC